MLLFLWFLPSIFLFLSFSLSLSATLHEQRTYRYHKLGEAHRILCEPDARNDDVRQYLAATPSLAWLHALRERNYAKASKLTQHIALGAEQKLASRNTLVSISKLLAKAYGSETADEAEAAAPAGGSDARASSGARVAAENVDLADAYLTLTAIQRTVAVDAVVSETTADRLRKRIPLTPDELVECLLDRIQQLEHGDSRVWERVDAAAQLSLHNAIELARGMISGLWDEVGVGAEERAAALDMMCPETQFSLGLLRRLRDVYAQLWKDACPGRIVSAVTNALVVAFAAATTGVYGEAERHAACVKAWAACIRADAAALLRANALRMQGSDKRAEAVLRDESVVLAALKAAQFQGVMLEGTVLQDALGGVGSLGHISAAELQALVEACWQLQ